MTHQTYTSHETIDDTIMDLTDSHESMTLTPLEYTRPSRRAVMITSPKSSTVRNVARRRNASELIDLIDDNDSVEVMMGSGRRMPFARKARRLFKADPNERSPQRLHDANPEVLVVNHMGENIEVVQIQTVTPPNLDTQVLEVFPDADLVAVQTLLEQLDNNVAAVVQYMSENKYTKSETSTIQSHGMAIKDEKACMYDFSAIDSFTPSLQYVAEATELLLCDFPFLSKAGAASCMSKYKNHYTLCHNMLLASVKGTGHEDAQYDRVLASLKRKPLREDQKQCIQDSLNCCRSPTLKKPQKRSMKMIVSDAVLINERQYVSGKVDEWMQLQQGRRDRALNKFLSQRNGTAVECSCCYDTYPFEDMASCRDEGHLFCLDCLKSFTENLIFGIGNLGVDKVTKQLASELQCFHGDGCGSGFSRPILQKALPSTSLKKYDEVQCEVSIKLAGLHTNMCSCPKCGFQADVPEGQRLFECPMTTCRFSSCRDCGEAAHIPLRYDLTIKQLVRIFTSFYSLTQNYLIFRCDEVVKDKVVTEGRLAVEEAITAAKLRRCPSCKKCFIKESGCNKITCSCGIKVCYLCQEKIQDYTHFCQQPHCDHKNEKCTKCPLYSNAEEDDARAMSKAGFEAAEKVKLANLGNEDIHIDVTGILNAK
jgi:hypothetical protein